MQWFKRMELYDCSSYNNVDTPTRVYGALPLRPTLRFQMLLNSRWIGNLSSTPACHDGPVSLFQISVLVFENTAVKDIDDPPHILHDFSFCMIPDTE